MLALRWRGLKMTREETLNYIEQIGLKSCHVYDRMGELYRWANPNGTTCESEILDELRKAAYQSTLASHLLLSLIEKLSLK